MATFVAARAIKILWRQLPRAPPPCLQKGTGPYVLFDYHRPDSLAAARALFARAEDPMYLSGGMTLIPSMKQRLAAPSDLIDLSGLAELQGVQLVDDGTKIRVGALTCHNDVANSEIIRQRLPVLAEVAGAIGDHQVRNRGTLGGSIANSDPAADWPAALVALKATVYTQDREIGADEFFRDLFETALAEDIVVARLRHSAPSDLPRAGIHCQWWWAY